ncbi:hypothetical protein B0O99DRAFT_693149 [Bisporella sp. PMI_857]|nr:hypothetical protein B0O99DRAFT_693149 [Bisporella sp. PMI_857]
MDPLSLSASIAGLASLAIELVKITRLVSDISNSGRAAQTLLNEATTLQHTLEQLASFLAGHGTHGNSFDKTSVLWGATRDCDTHLKSLVKTLKCNLGGSKTSRIVKRFKWPFTKEEHKEMMETLYRCRATFQFSLTLDGCKLLSRTSEDVLVLLQQKKETLEKLSQMQAMFPEIVAAAEATSKTLETLSGVMALATSLLVASNSASTTLSSVGRGVQKIQRKLMDEEYRRVLSWLSPYQHEEKQIDVSSKRSARSGYWLLENNQFKDWLQSSSQSPFLWCHGKPGAGKTVMTSLVIDHIYENSATANCGLAYFYCDYREKDIQSPMYILSSILKQLVALDLSSGAAIPVELRLAYDYRERATFKFSTLESHLQDACQRFPRTYIIFDAFDECDYIHRQTVLRTLNSLVRIGGVSIYITSRPHPADLKRTLSKAHQIAIEATESDISDFLNETMETHEDFMENHGADKTLRSDILAAIVKASQRGFLLPALQIPIILEQPTRSEIRNALARMPKKVEDTFTASLQRIQRQEDSCATLGMRALQWIFFSKEPLSPKALLEALSILLGDLSLDSDNKPVLKLLVGYCMGLVEVDSETETIRLVHLTLYQYFQKHRADLFPSGEASMLGACLTYLSFDVFKEQIVYDGLKNLTLLRWLKDYHLLPYAVRNWGKHAHACPGDNIFEPVTQFLDANSVWLLAEFVYDFGTLGEIRLLFGSKDTGYRTEATRLEIAAIHGLETVVLHLLRRNGFRAQSDDGNAQTALRLGVWLNHKNVVDILLNECSLPPNQRSPDLRFCPLWAAREHSNLVLERKLLQHGWLPGASEICCYLKPVFKRLETVARRHGEADKHEPKCTVDEIFSVTAPTFNLDFVDWLKGYLLLAIEKSSTEMIESLFLYKNEIEARLKSSASSGYPVRAKSANASMEIFKKQIWVNVDSRVALRNNLGQKQVIFHLLGQAGKRTGASFNWLANIFAAPSPFGKSELHIAAQWGLGYVCLRLVAVKGLSNGLDNKNRTPLWEAIINGNEYVAGILLGGGSNPTLRDSDGNTPLSAMLSMQADGIKLNYRHIPGVAERIYKIMRDRPQFAFLTSDLQSQRLLKNFHEPPGADRKQRQKGQTKEHFGIAVVK